MYPPSPIDHRSVEHQYTESLGHEVLPPLPPTCMQMHFPVTGNITFSMIIIMITCGARPKQSPTTPGQYYLLEHADMLRYSGQINPFSIEPSATELYYTRSI